VRPIEIQLGPRCYALNLWMGRGQRACRRMPPGDAIRKARKTALCKGGFLFRRWCPFKPSPSLPSLQVPVIGHAVVGHEARAPAGGAENPYLMVISVPAICKDPRAIR
jgi:hypothetical protein